MRGTGHVYLDGNDIGERYDLSSLEIEGIFKHYINQYTTDLSVKGLIGYLTAPINNDRKDVRGILIWSRLRNKDKEFTRCLSGVDSLYIFTLLDENKVETNIRIVDTLNTNYQRISEQAIAQISNKASDISLYCSLPKKPLSKPPRDKTIRTQAIGGSKKLPQGSPNIQQLETLQKKEKAPSPIVEFFRNIFGAD